MVFLVPWMIKVVKIPAISIEFQWRKFPQNWEKRKKLINFVHRHWPKQSLWPNSTTYTPSSHICLVISSQLDS